MAVEPDVARLGSLLDAASQAADVLAATALDERAGWLDNVADALDDASDRLVSLADEETHLGPGRLTGELKRTTFQLRLFASVVRKGEFLEATIDHADDQWGMGPRPDLRRMLRPLGPVAVFAASNFPFAFSVAGGDTASALAAGSPVILKAHPGHPRLSVATSEIVIETLEKAAAPTGIFASVSGVEVGRMLVTDPRIQAASFTGSIAGGRALFDLAVARPTPIPFYGELGSVNPAFVTRSAAAARSEAIASGFTGSMSLGVGQFCTKPGVLLVPAGSPIIGLVAAAAAQIGSALMLNQRLADGFEHALADLESHPDVEMLVRGKTGDGGAAPSVGRTTLAALLADAPRLTEERFGPAALIVEYDDETDLLAAADAFSGQLTATVHGSDTDAIAPQLLELLAQHAGRVLWNGWPTGVSVTYAMQHGGPYPAATSSQTTSVGTTAIGRFLRPVSYQNVPESLLPPALLDANPWAIPQRVDGVLRLPAM
jgi:NADP-dependent aldehyde dehydrogenase